jgi:transcriptional regulator NrdR family protein
MTQEQMTSASSKPIDAKGVDCRECGAPMRVLDTRTRRYEVWRRRECTNRECGWRATTREEIVKHA